MSFQPQSALGYSSSPVLFLNQDEVLWACGNTVVVHSIKDESERLLRGKNFGVQTFATCPARGLIAVVGKGFGACVNVHSGKTFGLLGSVNLNYELGYSAAAFSADGDLLAVCGEAPNNTLVIVDWKKGEAIVEAKLPKPIESVSFHPYDKDIVATTGGGLQHVWKLEKLWDCFDFTPKPVELGGSYEPTCHAWFNKGLYSGTSSGEVFAIDMATLKPYPAPGATDEGAAAKAAPAAATAIEQESAEANAAEASSSLPPLMVRAFDANTPVLSIACNRDVLAVAGSDPRIVLFSHAQPVPKLKEAAGVDADGNANSAPPVAPSFQLRYEHSLGVAGAKTLSFDCKAHNRLAAGTLDGMVCLIETGMTPVSALLPNGLICEKESLPTSCIVDAHVGAVTGLCAHTTEPRVLSCGMDGSVRVWDMVARTPVSKRTFSSAQTALAVARSRPIAAVGSETGVIRVLCISPVNPKPLQVLWRRRVHTSAISNICFNPGGDWMASVAKDNCVWFTFIALDGSAIVMGHVPCPEPILSIAWPDVEGEHSVLASLASGLILALTLSDIMANCKTPCLNPGMRFMNKDFSVKVVKVESPMLRMTCLSGERYGDLLCLGADKHIHKISLPTDNSGWLGAKGRALRSTAKVGVHRRPDGAVTLSNNNQLLLSASGDGHACMLTPGLLMIQSSTEGGQAPAALDAEDPPGLHDSSAGGACFVAFDAVGRNFLTAGHDGSLFMYSTQGESHITTEAYKYRRALSTSAVDHDGFDEVSELTEAEHRKKTGAADVAAGAGAGAGGGGGAAAPAPPPGDAPPPPPPSKGGITTKQHLRVLEDRLLRALQANTEAPELERVDNSAFIIFRGLLNELKAEADKRVESVYGAVQREHLTLELVTERVRSMCWDELEERGESVTGMRNGVEVHNFPLRQFSDQKLRKVTALRRVEIMEAHQREVEERAAAAAEAGSEAAASTLSKPATKPSPREALAAGAGPSAAEKKNPTEAKDAAAAAAAAAPANEVEVEDAAGDEVDSTPRGTKGSSTEAIDSVEELLYPDLQLYGQLRKRTQMELLRRQVHNLKVQFNYEFAAVAKVKVTESEKIMDLNQRIDETIHDLAKLSVAVQKDERFEVSFPEDMVHVLTVNDAEVKVDRTAAEKLRSKLQAKAAAAAHEAGGRVAAASEDGGEKAKEGAGLGERALRQMMGGTLESKEDEDTEFSLVRPEWMDGNPKMFTESQLKEFKEFQIKEKVLMEEKAKRVASLEMELRNLKAMVDDTTTRFDDLLCQLQNKKMAARAEVAFCESRIIDITANIASCAETGDAAERDLYSRLTSSKEAANRVTTLLMEKRGILAELEAKAAEVAAEEKLLDRNFKKEFIDTEALYPKLLQLYRLRTAASSDDEQPAPTPGTKQKLGRAESITSVATQRTATATESAQVSAARAPAIAEGSIPQLSSKHEALMREVGAMTLDPFPPLLPVKTAAKQEEPEKLEDSYRPDMLDHEWWQRLVAYRAQKVQAETQMKTLNAKVALLLREIPRLALEEAELTAESDSTMRALTALRNARRMALYDGSMQLRLKAGQVEAEPPQACSSDMSQAIFINRSLVEGVNSVVHTKGLRKVELLTAIKNFKKGIYQLEWEHKRGDMMISDLREKTRELQLLHVTRDMQMVFKDGEERATTNDSANLEALAKQREKLHKKALMDRAKQMKKLAKLMEAKQTQNHDVSQHLVTLEKVLYEQERLRQSMQSVDEQVTRRMRSLVTHKRLKEIAEAQASEVAALAAELDKLRLRTYPTFVEPNRMQVPPDLNASCFTASKRSVR